MSTSCLPHQAARRIRDCRAIRALYTMGSQQGKPTAARLSCPASPAARYNAAWVPMTNTAPAVSLPDAEVRCAQCGGVLHPDEGQIFLTCPYCGSAVFLDKSKVVFHWSLTCTVTPRSGRRQPAALDGGQPDRQRPRPQVQGHGSPPSNISPCGTPRRRRSGKEARLSGAGRRHLDQRDQVAGHPGRRPAEIRRQPRRPGGGTQRSLSGHARLADRPRRADRQRARKPRWCICPSISSSTTLPARATPPWWRALRAKCSPTSFPPRPKRPISSWPPCPPLVFLCVSTFPLVGYAANRGAGLGLGLLACLGAGLVVAMPVFILAAVVSAKV